MGHVISEICVEPQAAQTWKYFTQGLKERIVSLDLEGIGSHRVTQVHKWKKVGWHETTKRVETQFFTFVFNSDVIHVIPWRATTATISRMALWRVAKARSIKNDMMLEALQLENAKRFKPQDLKKDDRINPNQLQFLVGWESCDSKEQ